MALGKADKEYIFRLADELTGSSSDSGKQPTIYLANVERRIHQLGLKTLNAYLNYVDRNSTELIHLISMLTIHTTAWFRESLHFEKIESYIVDKIYHFQRRKLRFLSIGCSTGEEVYSFALLLWAIQERFPDFDFLIDGCDLDSLSLNKAKSAVYSIENVSMIPVEYHRYLLFGKAHAEGYFTLDPPIRARCKFRKENILTLKQSSNDLYDIVVCRNLLIYFTQIRVRQCIENMLAIIQPMGVLCLGLSEAIGSQDYYHFRSIGPSLYVTKPQPKAQVPNARRSVLVIEKDNTKRSTLCCLLEVEFHVLKACTLDEAGTFLQTISVDLIILDLDLPGMDCQAWLDTQLRKELKSPIVIVSETSSHEANQVLRALENGAQDHIEKSHLVKDPESILRRLIAIADSRLGLAADPAVDKKALTQVLLRCPDLIVIGASTGGTDALSRLLLNMPQDSPPIMVVQHIAASFAQAFAERLASVSGLILAPAVDGTILKRGHLYIAQGDYHISVKAVNSVLTLMTSNGPAFNGHRPSVDVLFHSAAQVTSKSVVGILLTGMGRDGAQGLLALFKAGNVTFAQSEESCIVFGMPKEAIKLGAASRVSNIEQIRRQLQMGIELPEPLQGPKGPKGLQGAG